jgi:hypothetical protein
MNIPEYLRALAACVRDLICTSNAVYVDLETAIELDTLSTLPWNGAPLLVLQETATAPGQRDGVARPVSPADFALGWLLASRALSQGQIWHDNEITCQEVLTSDRQRAAQCAELAALSARITTAPLTSPDACVLAHNGTWEGARAVWQHIVDMCRTELKSAQVPAQLRALAMSYKRELQAMSA